MKPSAKKNKATSAENTLYDPSLPSISLILPFDSKMKHQSGLLNYMTDQADKVEEGLLKEYSKEKVLPVMNKLRHLIKGMRCRSDGKTVGIFVSSFAEKIYYFTPTHLEERRLPVLAHRQELFNKNKSEDQ